ncbi:hypothetical protein [Helicobacter zhangjianzhongii]|nr:hypothetical protein [Helicobacter sp. CPD2-1]MDL0080817.1 hypothetical protein [Helicobacter sp. CPD2-1]
MDSRKQAQILSSRASAVAIAWRSTYPRKRILGNARNVYCASAKFMDY